MSKIRFLRAGLLALVALLTATAFCSDLLHSLTNQGSQDWDLFYFHAGSTYRSVVEFGEFPLWNPWYRGGFPSIGNAQVPLPDFWFLLDLIAGPIPALRFRIIGHYALGLLAMYWCARQFQNSRLAATLAAGTFFFSTWFALHIHSGHLWILPAAYAPLVIGFLHRARSRWIDSLSAAFCLAMMILGGGVHPVTVFTATTGILAGCWSVQDRSLRPIGAFLIMVIAGSTLVAYRMLPAMELIRSFPRTTIVGGQSWNLVKDSTAGEAGEDDGDSVAPSTQPTDPDDAPREIEPRGARRSSRLELVQFLGKIVLGREQRSNTRYFHIQGFMWQEYGTYLGPIVLLLLLMFPLVFRGNWPLIATGTACFLAAMGNFGWFSPWALLHHLPVFNNMRCPSRFLIPTAFVASLLAAAILDELRRRLENSLESERSRRRVEFVAIGLVAAALADSFFVGRASLRDCFTLPPLEAGTPLPNIITIRGERRKSTKAMYANYCSLQNGEVIPYPIHAHAIDGKEYRGELYFVPEQESAAPGNERPPAKLAIESWSPNHVTLTVKAEEAGTVVLNRNWGPGWTAAPPFVAAPHEGLIGAAVSPGEHRIEFQFSPKTFRIGLAVSLFTLIAGIAQFVLHGRRRRALNGADTQPA